ncbi:MAG: hypothetical protein RLZZ262_2453 [Bacteroidota bacterium]|jgi:hypothetical protein
MIAHRTLHLSMKKLILATACCTIGLQSCDPKTLEGVISTFPSSQSTPLSNEEIIQGLKEALRVGAQTAVKTTSAENGFLNDPLIRIPFPAEAQSARDWAMSKGLANQVNTFETTLNRAAEKASIQAFEIFADAIVQMTVQDAYNILHGEKNAATEFLKRTTTAQLKQSFAPIVNKAIQDVELTKYWEPITTGYNATTLLTGKPKVNTDLEAYVLDRALSGLFTHVAKEEERIRINPAARINEILKKVFGSLDKK